MWPFGRKKPPAPSAPPDLPTEDIWSIGEGELDGEPMLIRINTTAQEYAGHPGLPVRLGIAIPLNAPDAHGLPEPSEAMQLDMIEERIFQAIDACGRVVFAITTSGMREVVSYVRSAGDAEDVAAVIRNTIVTHEIHHHVEVDPEWEEYRRLV